MLKKLAIVAALGLAAAACGVKADGPPEIQVDRSTCDHCRMFISEPRHAAAYRSGAAEPRLFDDIGCLLAAARNEHTTLRVWFQDADGGGWISAGDAIVVSSPQIRTPMSGGMAAYRTRAAAERAAATHQGQIRTIEDLLRSEEGR